MSVLKSAATGFIAAIVGMVAVAAVSVIEPSTPNTEIAAVADVQSSDVMRAYDGHFRATADVNGGDIEMLVDTGASIVLLTHKDAVKIGVDMDALTFNVPVLTANGKSHVAAVTLDVVSIGDVAVENVRAAVAEPGMLHASLLGMSFIGEIEEAVIRKDRLILRN